MINIAIIGYGNVGKKVVEAVLASSDLNLSGLVSQSITRIDAFPDVKVVKNIDDLENIDVAVLCCPSRAVKATAIPILKRGISTVDSYDIHSDIYELTQELDAVAKENNVVAVSSAGWDPGTDSIIRALMLMSAPKGLTYTNFGPGMSMGHSTVVCGFDGVKDALSITMPAGNGLHRRMVYIELDGSKDFASVKNNIINDPYFKDDYVFIEEVDDIEKYRDVGHGVHIERKGISGMTHNQQFEYNMKINNPALTSQLMVSAARAASRQKPGAYTVIEIPIIDFLEGDRETNIRELV